MKRSLTWLVLLSTGLSAFGQSNQIPGTDVSLGLLSSLTSVGRSGSFPNGLNAFAMATTSCNLGSVNVPWLSPMQENHPYIGFMLARQEPGATRLVQISDYSYVKHGFFALSNDQCTPCQQSSNGTFLGVGCSDTYAVSNNADNFWLGPPAEINAWLGEWESTCSFFDAGLTPTPPFNCDNVRSFSIGQSGSLGPVGNRVRVTDADLNVGGASYFYYSYYAIRGEPEANRTNNMGSRQFTPNWGGSSWGVSNTGPLVSASILTRWTGATVTSNTNGSSDGRVYVAVKVTGPVNGLYHYEYALHNRDNHRQVGALRLPICPGTQILNAGFRDIDSSAGNNWVASVQGNELVWNSAGTGLGWNNVFNFWFDSPAGPSSGSAQLVQLLPGPGAASFAVSTTVPGNNYSLTTGPGCANLVPGSLRASAQPTLGNGSFAVLGLGVTANSAALLYGSPLTGSLPLGGSCVVHLGGVLGAELFQYGSAVSTGAGGLTFPVPIPNNPNVAGLPFEFQAVVLPVGGGPALGVAELTSGMRIRLGSAIGCL
jgi:hypothetical protein